MLGRAQIIFFMDTSDLIIRPVGNVTIAGASSMHLCSLYADFQSGQKFSSKHVTISIIVTTAPADVTQ